MPRYDYLVVGAGLFGSVFAHEAVKNGKSVMVIDKRSHIGGNCYTVDIENITVHRYGAHIFHTDDEEVWNYMNQFADFNRFTNSPIAVHKGKVYSLPFSMYTFQQMWGVTSPASARSIIEYQKKHSGIDVPRNLEEQAISMVGTDIYEALVKGYTEKQWGKPCKELPTSIIRRLPVRYTWNNTYFTNPFQGIPIGGYTKVFERLLEGSTVNLNSDFLENQEFYKGIAEKIVYTGCIDEYFRKCFGSLEYRSVTFDIEQHEEDDFQGNAVVNYTDADVPWTRIIEHKHFEPRAEQRGTVISYERSVPYGEGKEPSYPINDLNNDVLYARYADLAEREKNVIFGGRLGTYKYMDMDKVIRAALDLAKKEFARW
ncbi:MAG: UDP-galactopyranose mutase [Ruminococcus sp.]|nr:UDP-galactopyranose mutase [Ruminococcus sp.]